MEGVRSRNRARRVEEVPPTVSTRSTRSSATPSVSTTSSTVGVRTRQSPSRRASPARRPSPGRRASPGRGISPSRTKASPVKKPRPKSVTSGSNAVIEKDNKDSVVEDTKTSKPNTDEKEKSPESSGSNLPTTLTTNTMSRAPNKSSVAQSTIHSSYNSTEQTYEMRSTTSTSEKIELSKVADYLRRSVSKTFSSEIHRNENTHTPTTNTENGSQYSRSASRSVYDDDSASKAEFSDTEQKEEEEEGEEVHFKSMNATQRSIRYLQTCRKVPIPREFGGWLGALILMVVGTILIFYLQMSCMKSACAFKIPTVPTLAKLSIVVQKYFKTDSVVAFLTFHFGIFILSALLFGKRVRVPSEKAKIEYKFNLLPIAILITVAAAAGEYYKYHVVDFVLKNYRRFCIYGVISAFVMAVWAYLRPVILKNCVDDLTKENVYGKSGNFFTDFAQGRQINPKWLGLVDLKLVFYRASILTTLVFTEAFIYKNVQIPWIPEGMSNVTDIVQFYVTNVKYDSVALLSSTLLLMYLLDIIIFEHHLISSFELKGEGFGYLLLLRYAATPFLLTSVAKYTFDRHIALRCKYTIHVALVLLFVGLLLKRFSNALKYKYRTDPNNRIFLGLATIHTFQGRRLMLGPLWGKVRQPNYTGDIIALLSLTVPLYLQFAWPPMVSILIVILIILHRCIRVNARNQQLYHSSWVGYRSLVPNYLLPKIF